MDNKKLLTLTLIGLVISFLIITPAYASQYSGKITSLHANDAPNPGDPITISCSGINTGRPIPSGSGIYYVVTDASGAVVATHTRSFGPLNTNQGFYDSWTTTNTNFPSKGDYTITATWYDPHFLKVPGHEISSMETTFYSIPSPWLIAAIAGLMMVIAGFARSRRWWLSFYLVGSIAVVASLISFFVLTGYDNYIMSVEAQSMAYVASLLGMPSQFIPPNAFLFPDPTGWSIFGIGLECSSLIEISVFVALLLFYPSYSWKKKLKYATIGVVATYAANVVRILSIVYIVAIFGKTSVYLAHAIIGKMVFFLLIIIVYWYLLTKPTMSVVRENIKSGKF